MLLIITSLPIPLYIIKDHKANALALCNPDPSGITVIMCSWHGGKKALNIANSGIFPHPVILTNTPQELEDLKPLLNNGVDAIYCNHNAFINENTFELSNTTEPRPYKIVIDSCFCTYKNVDVACKIDNVVHIGYYKPNCTPVVPNFGTIANISNGVHRVLSRNRVSEIYNTAEVGGIFSSVEGGCQASTQYLLCGLPVISIKSRGGRDVWYNKRNSLICDNNSVSVQRAVNRALTKLNTGQFSRIEIRKDCILQMNEHRDRVVEYLCDKIKVLTTQSIPLPEIKNIVFPR